MRRRERREIIAVGGGTVVRYSIVGDGVKASEKSAGIEGYNVRMRRVLALKPSNIQIWQLGAHLFIGGRMVGVENGVVCMMASL